MPKLDFSRYKWTLRLLILSPFLLAISILLMGGGHGWFEPAIFLFPFAMLVWSLNGSMVWLFMIAGMIQYPAYGMLVDYFGVRKKKVAIAILLFVAHMIAAFLLLVYVKNRSSE
jgi:MFS family permease